MINDKARQLTDKELSRLERELHREYQRAYNELKADWQKYLKQYAELEQPYIDAIRHAKNIGDTEAWRAAKKELKRIQTEHTLNSRQYQRVRDDLAYRLANIDKAAYELVNGKLAGVYAINFNALAVNLPTGYAYGLITPQTVRNLAYKELNLLKAFDWNKKQLNSEVLQGILRGESMDKIAARLANVFGANERQARRAARTAVTYAENQGRLDSYHEAADNGTVLVKVWSSANDNRTRDSHKPMPTGVGGEEREIDEPFSNGLQCPGDQNGEPEEYYNCRCALGTRIVGYRKKDGSIVYV